MYTTNLTFTQFLCNASVDWLRDYWHSVPIWVCFKRKIDIYLRWSLSFHLAVGRASQSYANDMLHFKRFYELSLRCRRGRAYTRHAIKAIDYYLFVWKGISPTKHVSGTSRVRRRRSWEVSIFDHLALLRLEIVSTISIFSNDKYCVNKYESIPARLLIARPICSSCLASRDRLRKHRFIISIVILKELVFICAFYA